jgi:hypothetical protein
MAPPNVRELAWRAVRDGEMYYVQVTAPPPVSGNASADLRGAGNKPECLLCVADTQLRLRDEAGRRAEPGHLKTPRNCPRWAGPAGTHNDA